MLFAVREGQIAAVGAAGTRRERRRNAPCASGPRTRSQARPARAGLLPPHAPPSKGPSALVLAVGSAHYELASLLDKGADPNAAAQGWTALHQLRGSASRAASNGPAPNGSGSIDSLKMVRRLAAHGANLNARVTRRPNVGMTHLNLIGGTPFFLAARTGDAELMRLLVELGADPLLPNEDGTTPLMAAAGARHAVARRGRGHRAPNASKPSSWRWSSAAI